MKETIQEHHINGIHSDKRKANIAKLCASCHNITFKAASPQVAIRLFNERHRRRESKMKAWRRARKTGWWSKNNGIRAKPF